MEDDIVVILLSAGFGLAHLKDREAKPFLISPGDLSQQGRDASLLAGFQQGIDCDKEAFAFTFKARQAIGLEPLDITPKTALAALP